MCVWKEDRIWDLSFDENTPSAMHLYHIQRHWQSCSDSMRARGNPPDTGAFISPHILSLMNSAACNGTYRSCGGGASPLSFIHVCIWCERARSLCRRGELFMAVKTILRVFRSTVIISINTHFFYINYKRTFSFHTPGMETVWIHHSIQLIQNKRHVCTQALKC